jgi:hypothetical protein
MSSPRKPKPVRLNLVPGAPPKAGEEPLDSPSSVLAPQLDAISIPKSYTALDLKVLSGEFKYYCAFKKRIIC